MSGSRQQPTVNGQAFNEGGTSVNAAPQVIILGDGTIQVIYASHVAQIRDLKLLKAGKIIYDQVVGASSTDRLTSLPMELQLKIVKCLIPNRGRIAIGYDYNGPNTSGIRPGSLNISRVSKHLSKITLQVLYGHRCFRISASCEYRECDYVLTATSMASFRRKILRNNVNQAHPIHSPLACFELFMFHTPAHEYLTRLEVMITKFMGLILENGKLLKVLRHAKALRLLEFFMVKGTLDVMWFVNELRHIQTIKVFSWPAQYILYETKLAKRNRDWEHLSNAP